MNSKYSKLVNFDTNLILPRHRWFDVKEGFSRKLVSTVLKDLDIKPSKGKILDPFSGSGTTTLTCAQLGYESIGIEINPFLYFLSKTKLINNKLNINKYINHIKKLEIDKNNLVPKLQISEKLFGKQLDQIISIKSWINSLPNKSEQKLLKLAFLSSLEESSFAKKDGNGLRYPKTKKPTIFLNTLINKINIINNDINNDPLISSPKVINEDILNICKKNKFQDYEMDNLSLVLFSPPYANCFDYTEVYKVELWFGDFVTEYTDLKKIRKNSLSSHLNKTYNEQEIIEELKQYINKINIEKLWSNKIPKMLIAYFLEMELIIKNIYNNLVKNGHCVIVIANSAYNNIVIPTDLIFEQIAKRIGFKETNIHYARKLNTSSQQINNVNHSKLLRESLIFLKK